MACRAADLCFQSIACTQAANNCSGIDLAILAGPRHGGAGLHVFRDRAGPCLSAEAHHGVDQQTLEARAYGVARHFRTVLGNSIVGLIGPEYLYDGREVEALSHSGKRLS
jgi:ethanolamine ammonia-lyase large subunit